jgi:hypothetical protein
MHRMPARPTPSQTHLASVAASRALLTVSAVAGAAAALAASAPVRRPAQHRTPAPQDDVDRLVRRAGAGGPARAVWRWNPAFLAGDPGAEPLLRTFAWVAAVLGDDAPPTGAPRDGTVTVRQTGEGSGSLTVTATDDDADLARALGTLTADDVLVADGPEWLAVRGDRVRPLHGTEPDRTVAEHRAVLRAGAGDPDGR